MIRRLLLPLLLALPVLSTVVGTGIAHADATPTLVPCPYPGTTYTSGLTGTEPGLVAVDDSFAGNATAWVAAGSPSAPMPSYPNFAATIAKPAGISPITGLPTNAVVYTLIDCGPDKSSEYYPLMPQVKVRFVVTTDDATPVDSPPNLMVDYSGADGLVIGDGVWFGDAIPGALAAEFSFRPYGGEHSWHEPDSANPFGFWAPSNFENTVLPEQGWWGNPESLTFRTYVTGVDTNIYYPVAASDLQCSPNGVDWRSQVYTIHSKDGDSDTVDCFLQLKRKPVEETTTTVAETTTTVPVVTTPVTVPVVTTPATTVPTAPILTSTTTVVDRELPKAGASTTVTLFAWALGLTVVGLILLLFVRTLRREAEEKAAAESQVS